MRQSKVEQRKRVEDGWDRLHKWSNAALGNKKNGTGCGLKKSTAASEGLTLMKEEYGHEPAETHPWLKCGVKPIFDSSNPNMSHHFIMYLRISTTTPNQF